MGRHQASALVPMRLKLKYDKPLSHLAYNFNLRCYTVGGSQLAGGGLQVPWQLLFQVHAIKPNGEAVQVDPRLTPG
jgi:hypothetical protein